MTRLALALAAAALVLTGCSSSTPATDSTPAANAAPESALLTEFDLDGMDGAQIVDHLDRLGGADRPKELMASVRVDELLLSTADEELAVDLPDDRFYLSVAPYVERTHECFFHSLTTCQGEMVEKDVQLTIVDDEGTVLVDEQTTTFANGFVGTWLPRDVSGTVTVTADGRTGSVPFSTGDDGATCLTTLQLA